MASVVCLRAATSVFRSPIRRYVVFHLLLIIVDAGRRALVRSVSGVREIGIAKVLPRRR
jgi:hypothetical protein